MRRSRYVGEHPLLLRRFEFFWASLANPHAVLLLFNVNQDVAVAQRMPIVGFEHIILVLDEGPGLGGDDDVVALSVVLGRKGLAKRVAQRNVLATTSNSRTSR